MWLSCRGIAPRRAAAASTPQPSLALPSPGPDGCGRLAAAVKSAEAGCRSRFLLGRVDRVALRLLAAVPRGPRSVVSLGSGEQCQPEYVSCARKSPLLSYRRCVPPPPRRRHTDRHRVCAIPWPCRYTASQRLVTAGTSGGERRAESGGLMPDGCPGWLGPAGTTGVHEIATVAARARPGPLGQRAACARVLRPGLRRPSADPGLPADGKIRATRPKARRGESNASRRSTEEPPSPKGKGAGKTLLHHR